MRFRATPGAATVAAALSAGFAVAAILSVATDVFGSGPAAGVCALTAVAIVASAGIRVLTPVARAVRGAWCAGAIGAVLVWRAEDVSRGIAAVGGLSALPVVGALMLALASLLLAAPLVSGLRRAGTHHFAIVALGVWLGQQISREGALSTVFALAMVEWTVAPPLRHPRDMAPGRSPYGMLGAFTIFLALATWVGLRTGMDPTPAPIFTLAAAGMVGVALPRGRMSTFLGLIFAGAAASVGWFRGAETVALGEAAVLSLFAVSGVAAGLASPRRGFGARFAVTGAVLLLVMPEVPPGIVERLARADATVPQDGVERARIQNARDESVLVAAHFGATGASALRTRKGRVFAEFDGAVADPQTRAGEAERFAGLLATCATSNRTRARIGGDDLGLVAGALREAGFVGIDTAVPDAPLVRAQAEALPTLARTLLHPSVRPVALPAPALLRAGAKADAVIEVARSGWTDGRNHAPDAHGIGAARAGLLAGGTYVLVLGTLHLDDGVLENVLRTVADDFPAASLWLPPSGVDTAIIVAGDAPIPWSALRTCAASSTAAALDLDDPLALATLALADHASLVSLPRHGFFENRGLPGAARARPTLRLTSFKGEAAEAAHVFGDDAPAELQGRAAARALFLDVVRKAGTGNVMDAINQSRALADTPGGSRALDPLIRPQLETARQAIARGRKEGATSHAWQEADAALSTAALIHPKSAQTRCMQGELAAATSQWERAESAFSDCAALDATSPDGLDGLALVRRTRGNLKGAEEALRQSQVRFPQRWQSAHNLGFFLFESGQFDEAERWLRQAAATEAETQSTDPSPHLALARLFLATDRAALAMAEARRAAVSGNSAEAEYLQGGAQWELKQTAAAEAAFRRAIQLDGRHAEAHGGLGMCQAARGDYAAAADSFRTALALSPSNVAARDNLRLLLPLLKEKEQ